MRRREFITLRGGAAAWPLAAHAQIPIIGVLSIGSPDSRSEMFKEGLRDIGYVEGKNIEFLHRFPAEQPERFRTLARELAADKVDAIVAVTALGAKEARQATSTIPIVFVIVSDPVGSGLVESLARPGGNATGLSLMSIDLSGKRLALLKEASVVMALLPALTSNTVP